LPENSCDTVAEFILGKLSQQNCHKFRNPIPILLAILNSAIVSQLYRHPEYFNILNVINYAAHYPVFTFSNGHNERTLWKFNTSEGDWVISVLEAV